jgi:hypothetical protein
MMACSADDIPANGPLDRYLLMDAAYHRRRRAGNRSQPVISLPWGCNTNQGANGDERMGKTDCKNGLIPGNGKADSPVDDSRIGVSTIPSASGGAWQGETADGQGDRDHPRRAFSVSAT